VAAVVAVCCAVLRRAPASLPFMALPATSAPPDAMPLARPEAVWLAIAPEASTAPLALPVGTRLEARSSAALAVDVPFCAACEAWLCTAVLARSRPRVVRSVTSRARGPT
jgi:hypothetical protein